MMLTHRPRKQYPAFGREEVGRTISDWVKVDAELCEALIAGEGRIRP
jgi:hypothetical protein